MPDQVSLLINGQRITNFVDYEIDADLFTADDSFNLTLSNPETTIESGQLCTLVVNGTVELSGIAEKVTRSTGKEGTTVRIEGRDLMSIAVDSSAEDFVTIQGKTVKSLAEMIIGKTTKHPALPYLSRLPIIYQENFIGRGKGKKQTVSQPLIGSLDTPQKIGQIEPGMSVFEVLSNYAASRGFMFWLQYQATGPVLVFGRPKSGGPASCSLVNRVSGDGNNIKSSTLSEDISKAWSQITVISQTQGHDEYGLSAGKVNTKHTRSTDLVPWYKPLVVRMTHDSQSPALHARLLEEKQRHDSYQYTATVVGHSQRGRNWSINEICTVIDEDHSINRDLLVYGRTFIKSRAEGTITRLRLSLPGCQS